MLIKPSLRKQLKVFLLWYMLSALALVAALLVFLMLDDNVSDERLWTIFWMSLGVISKSTTAYIIALIPYALFVLIRSFVRDFKRNRWLGLLKSVLLKAVLPIMLVWGALQLIDNYRYAEHFDYQWDSTVENTSKTIRNNYEFDQKQRGIHVFELLSDTTDLEILKTNNVEWITFSPFISQDDYNTPSLGSSFGTQDSAGRWQRYLRLKQLTDRYGFKVMLKPHIWLNNRPGGIWRSNIQMTSDQDWDKWFESYSTFMISYARIAEALGIEQFCIGTELNTSVMEQPEKWLELIQSVREVYSGKLTYAANWDDDLENYQMWQALDYIGIQAYFPIAKSAGPELEELEAGWQSHYPKLKALSEKFDRPILFTEIGYKTTRDAGMEPWAWNTLSNRFYKQISRKTQALCYEAFFNTVWQQPWFVGAHIWEWQSRGSSSGNNNSFTIEGKPALNVVARGFR